jgi:hypothetical protein
MADKSKRDSVNLTQGILLDQLPDGGTLVGHINGEDVLLARPEPELWVQLDLRHPERLGYTLNRD